MKENQKRQLKSMIKASLFWLFIIGGFFYLISLIVFTLFDANSIELGTFKLKNGRTFELKSYPSNAFSSAELYLSEITNEDSYKSYVLRHDKQYNEFVYWRQWNDSLIQLVLQNEKEKDTIYMMIQKEEIILNYEPIY